MSFFKNLARAPRGIGRILRGKFKEGIADVGGGISALSGVAAPFNPLAAGIGKFVGNTLDKVDDPGGLGKMKLFKEGVAPAALTYAGGKVAGHLMNRGAGAAGELAQTPIPIERGLADSAGIAASLPSAPAATGVDAAASSFLRNGFSKTPSAELAAEVMAKNKVPRMGAGGYLKKIGGYFGDKEQGANRLLAASKLAETGLGAYGAYQEGAYLDYERKKEEEANERLRQYFAESGLGEKLLARMRAQGINR